MRNLLHDVFYLRGTICGRSVVVNYGQWSIYYSCYSKLWRPTMLRMYMSTFIWKSYYVYLLCMRINSCDLHPCVPAVSHPSISLADRAKVAATERGKLRHCSCIDVGVLMINKNFNSANFLNEARRGKQLSLRAKPQIAEITVLGRGFGIANVEINAATWVCVTLMWVVIWVIFV